MFKKSLVISIIIHILIFGGIFYYLEHKKKEEKKEFMTAQLLEPRAPSIPPPQPPPQTPLAKAGKKETVKPSKPIAPVRIPQRPNPLPQVPSEPKNPPPNPENMDMANGQALKRPESSHRPPGDIFDSDVIERHAMNSPTTRRSRDAVMPDLEESQKGGLSLQIDNMRYYGYIQRLKESIEAVWQYPLSDREKGTFGDLEISFTIRRDGTLGDVRLIRTSGHRSLDDAAIDALRHAAPFWPLPDEWGLNTFTIKGRFAYILSRRYAR